MKPLALVAAGGLVVTGIAIAHVTHQSIPDTIQDSPGAIKIQYSQSNPGLGKLLSLSCAIGVAVCVKVGLSQGTPVASTPIAATPSFTPVQSAIVPQQITNNQQLTTNIQQPVEYDEDPEIDPSSLPSYTNTLEEDPMLIHRLGKSPNVHTKTEVNLFDRMYSNHKRHIMIPAETGAGKTTILLGAIKSFYEATDGNVEFFGSTAKPSPCLGLETQKAADGRPRIINLRIDDPDSILLLIYRLEWLQQRLSKRQDQRTECEATGKPYHPKRNIIFLDEWNQTVALAAEYDRVHRNDIDPETERPCKPDMKGKLIALINTFLMMGREDEMAIWLFTQDHQVQNCHINTGNRKNLGILVPGMLGNMLGIEQALIDKTAIVASGKGKELLSEAEKLAASNPDRGIVYSNINGHELLVVPYLPNIKRERLFGTQAAQGKVILFPQAVGQSQFLESEQLEDYWN